LHEANLDDTITALDVEPGGLDINYHVAHLEILPSPRGHCRPR